MHVFTNTTEEHGEVHDPDGPPAASVCISITYRGKDNLLTFMDIQITNTALDSFKLKPI